MEICVSSDDLDSVQWSDNDCDWRGVFSLLAIQTLRNMEGLYPWQSAYTPASIRNLTVAFGVLESLTALLLDGHTTERASEVVSAASHFSRLLVLCLANCDWDIGGREPQTSLASSLTKIDASRALPRTTWLTLTRLAWSILDSWLPTTRTASYCRPCQLLSRR
ncbi:hypothetical protein BD413DRAFT_75922 [Trametes elegans]|nr:hypothetical protein BD413DRAFT_75922 [Trametes elegans]